MAATTGSKKDAAGNLSLRDEQRAMTRQRLLDAAREIFREKNYVVATVDDIASRARISRATFYLHYASKDELLNDLLAEDIEHQEALFRRLAATKEPGITELVAWIDNYLSKTRRSKHKILTLSLASALDPKWFRRFSEHRDRLISILGEGIPAFVLPPEPAPEREQRRISALLLLFQLEQLSLHAAQDGVAMDYHIGSRVLAQNFLDFIVANRPH